MKLQWKGVYPALTTKFKEDFTIDYEAFLANVACQLSSGIDGIILGGTLGEASALMGNEKSALIKATKEYVGDKVPVIINIAEQTTEAAIAAAKSRFRPILMTAFSFILGVLPLVVASGAGAEATKVMGMALLGGMVIATLLGVFFYPMLYIMIGKLFKYEVKRDLENKLNMTEENEN